MLPPASGSTPIGAGVADITQEDKPKVSLARRTSTKSLHTNAQAAIVAEYLAHGYVLGDHVIQRAIDFDRTSRLHLI